MDKTSTGSVWIRVTLPTPLWELIISYLPKYSTCGGIDWDIFQASFFFRKYPQKFLSNTYFHVFDLLSDILLWKTVSKAYIFFGSTLPSFGYSLVHTWDLPYGQICLKKGQNMHKPAPNMILSVFAIFIVMISIWKNQ